MSIKKSASGTRESDRVVDDDRISVVERINRHFNSLTKAERTPARLLKANYPLAGLEPLAGFAQRAGVSHPSVLRFIRKLGYSGYPEFQAALRLELDARLKSPLTKGHANQQRAGAGDDLLTRHADTVCDNIRQSVASLPRGEFEGALELLGDSSNTIYLLGGRFTDSLANYVYMHLRVLHPHVEHVTGPPVSWPEYLLDMDQHAVLLVFDIRRYQQEVVRFAGEAAERGAQIILMTDSWLSPIMARATHVLSAHIEAPSNWDSIIAMATLAEALIAGLNERNWSELEPRIRELESLRGRFENIDDAP